MNRVKFRIDVQNPGHFFACCGILDVMDRLFGTTTGYFSDDKFIMETDIQDPLRASIDKILPSEQLSDVFREESDQKDSVVCINGLNIRMDFWNHFDNRPTMKLFAGQASALKIIQRWAEHLFSIKDNKLLSTDPFSIHVDDLPSGFDSSTAWKALDVGFSLNCSQSKYNTRIKTYPVVEFFAHLGVQTYSWGRNGTKYTYVIWPKPLPILVAKVVASGALHMSFCRHFEFTHRMSGQVKILTRAYETNL